MPPASRRVDGGTGDPLLGKGAAKVEEQGAEGHGWRWSVGILRSLAMRLLAVSALILWSSACAGPGTAPEPQETLRHASLAEERGDWRRAAELWHRLHDGSNSAAARGLARSLEALGDAPGALRILAGVGEPTPDLLFDRGALRGRLGHLEQGALDLRAACALATSSVPARVQLAALLQELGRPDAALPVLREAVALAPRDPRLWRLLAAAAAGAGEQEQQRGAYLSLADLEGLQLSEALELALLVEGEPEHYATAAGLLAAGLEHDPSSGDGWRALAGLRGELGDGDGRVAALRAALELDPGDRQTLLELGRERASRAEWAALEGLVDHARALGDQDLTVLFEELLARRDREADRSG